MTTYVTVAIPYVNAAPHLGYAFELIEADLFARARRAGGEAVRFLGGTDDYSLKNVLAAEQAGLPTAAFVAAHADRFAALAEPLGVSFDDFIRTSSDPRHPPAVDALWRACAAAGDVYQRAYIGRYCVGCEQFYDGDDALDSTCPEHRTPLDVVTETNWFFRLSRYEHDLIELISSDTIAVEPVAFRDEVLAFLRRGLRDISVSRSVERARGWGIGVPDDPTQVVYVWFDALTNYISALGYGTPEATGGEAGFRRWWSEADERVHVIGKGILRFHAVYWPAFLRSAGLPLPTRIQVHPYLTVDGAKISKSAGATIDPLDVTGRFGTDAVRWWCARDVAETADTDVTLERIAARANEDLAHGVGNTVNRIVSLAHRYRGGVVPATGADRVAATEGLAETVREQLGRFERRAAARSVVAAVAAVNRDLEQTQPWVVARTPERAAELDRLLDGYLLTAAALAAAIAPIVPALAERLAGSLDRTTTLPPAVPAFDRIEPGGGGEMTIGAP